MDLYVLLHKFIFIADIIIMEGLIVVISHAENDACGVYPFGNMAHFIYDI